MTATLVGDEVDTLVAPLRAAVDGLLDAEFDRLAAAQVTALISAVEVQKRRLAAVDHRLIGQVRERLIAGETGAASPAAMLVQLLRVSPAEATARVGQAGELGPRRNTTGEALEPILPQTALAVAEGEVSAAQVSVISRTLEKLPSTLPLETFRVAEQFMVQAARHEHPGLLVRSAQLLLQRLDPDGREPAEQELQRRRGFDLHVFGDGSSDPRGRLTPEVTEALLCCFDVLAAPQPAVDADGNQIRDPRSASQRRHDALADVLARAMRTTDMPSAGGVPVTIVLHTQHPSITTPDATAGDEPDAMNSLVRTGHGYLWLMRQLLQAAGDAQLRFLVEGDAGEPLWLGRAHRLASTPQRIALAARDGGCCFPGCERPAAWSEAHHIREWQAGGPTDIDNLCLLCPYHHRHFEALGWQVTMAADRHPEWRPPAHLDPERRPIRNHAHHQRDLDFTVQRR